MGDKLTGGGWTKRPSERATRRHALRKRDHADRGFCPAAGRCLPPSGCCRWTITCLRSRLIRTKRAEPRPAARSFLLVVSSQLTALCASLAAVPHNGVHDRGPRQPAASHQRGDQRWRCVPERRCVLCVGRREGTCPPSLPAELQELSRGGMLSLLTDNGGPCSSR